MSSENEYFFRSQNIFLVPVSLKHCTDTYLGWFHDDEMSEFIESAHKKLGIGALEAFIKKNSDDGNIFLAIHLSSTEKHIGNIRIHSFDSKGISAEFGILIGEKNEWGKGAAVEAAQAVIDHCFRKTDLARITLGVISTNKRGIGFFKKLGFVQYKELDNYYRANNGQMVSVIRMAIEKDKWKI